MREQWRLLGVDPDLARQANAVNASAEPDDDETGDVELPPEMWDAWLAFLGTWSQWRVIAGMTSIWYEGIDQSCLASTLRMLRVKPKHWPRVYWQIRYLEDEARKLRNQKDGSG